jgi:hypothetical protein
MITCFKLHIPYNVDNSYPNGGFMKKQFAWISILIIGSLLLGACSLAKDLGAVQKAGNDFMTGLRDKQYQITWGMLTTSLQTELGTYNDWQNFASPRAFDTWSFSNTQVQNDEAQMDGDCALGADAYTLRIVFARVGTDWKISGINITAK